MLTELESRVRGVLFGQAIGDTWGKAGEFHARHQARRMYPKGLRRYEDMILSGPARLFRVDEWTDDTEMTLAIVDSLLERGSVDLLDIAHRFYRWCIDDGRGIGVNMATVLRTEGFLSDPEGVARGVYASFFDSNPAAPILNRPAPNGAVMRTAPLGIWEFRDTREVSRNAEAVCLLTHADPRCVKSCKLIAQLIASVLRGDDPEEWIDALMTEEEDRRWVDLARAGDLEALELDHDATMGYTYRAVAAGLWAWWHAPSYAEGIERIVYEGGDADTNAAVAGALMGARFGLRGIPEDWVEGLHAHKYLDRVSRQLSEAVSGRTVHDTRDSRD